MEYHLRRRLALYGPGAPGNKLYSIPNMSLDDAVSYRVRQEAFVSNLNGTSMAEIVLVCIPIPLGLWVLSETKV